MLQKVLERAKQRVADQTAALAQLQEQIAYAEKRGMKVLTGNLREQEKRTKVLLSNAESVVVEIEKDLGQLPLKGK